MSDHISYATRFHFHGLTTRQRQRLLRVLRELVKLDKAIEYCEDSGCQICDLLSASFWFTSKKSKTRGKK